ncbi:putative hydroxylase [Minicystis rosea]|nr:putative hydroxylase [Minicystis rosea]
MQRFRRFELRTTDVARAAAFYDAVLGHQGDAIVPLPAAAAARGAPAHWLGHIGVADIGGAEAVAAKLVAQGATRLGPQSGETVLLRDPGGAVVAVTNAMEPSRAGVVWHHLNTTDAARTAERHAEIFGWALQSPVDLGPGMGTVRPFSWSAGEASVGSFMDVAGRPEVHPHWLFQFGVPSLDVALSAVRAHGGTTTGPTLLPSGVRVAHCEDPQGAAFGLWETERGAA